MCLQVKKLIDSRAAVSWKGLLQQFVGRLHGMRPVPQGDVQSEPGEGRVSRNQIPGKTLASSIDPDNGIQGSSRFTVTIDDIQMGRVKTFAVGILFDVLGIARSGFSAPAHPQKRRGCEV